MIVLVIEDNAEQLQLIRTVLEVEQFVVDSARDGKEGLDKIEVRDYDLAIVDLDLPFIPGAELVKRVRELGLHTPILVLTAIDEVGSKVNVLDSGADDYLTKPFAVSELQARVRALLRRPSETLPNVLKAGGLEIMYGTHEVSVGGRRIKLTTNEFRLLDYLVRKGDRVCTRAMIEEHVWGYDQDHASNLIEVVVYNLRKKLGKDNKEMIETVQNIGYRFHAHEEKSKG